VGVTVAVVGAGYMAGEHARAFAAHDGVEIVGICGRSRARAEALARAYGATVYTDLPEMYRATKADLVIIAVNELAAPAICEQAFRLPWACLAEKPVGLTLPQAEHLYALATSLGARVYVGLNRRSYAATLKGLEVLGGSDGKRLISVLDQQDLVAVRASGQPEEVVANYMFANSIHLIDYLSVFARGEVVDVRHTAWWTPGSPEHVVASVTFSSGDIGVYQAVWDAPGPWAVSVTNPDVRIEMRPLERLSIQRRGERRLTPQGPDPIDSDFKPGLYRQAGMVLAEFAGNRTTLATLEDATRSMRLCARIYELQ
jgi:predicted dehydrogenase